MHIFKCKIFILYLVVFKLLFWHAISFAYVITYNIGPSWYAPSGMQVLNLDADTLNAYTINNNPRAILNNELFVGARSLIKPNLEGQIGISINKTSNAKISGDIWQEADPEFDNFYYNYFISHTALTVKGKILFNNSINYLQPYLSVSAGVASNRSFAFNQVAKIFESVVAYNFTHRTLTAFTYTAEAGVQQKLNDNLALGIGYEFADLGRSKLGPADMQVGNVVPYLNHLYINQLQFNVSYFIN